MSPIDKQIAVGEAIESAYLKSTGNHRFFYLALANESNLAFDRIRAIENDLFQGRSELVQSEETPREGFTIRHHIPQPRPGSTIAIANAKPTLPAERPANPPLKPSLSPTKLPPPWPLKPTRPPFLPPLAETEQDKGGHFVATDRRGRV